MRHFQYTPLLQQNTNHKENISIKMNKYGFYTIYPCSFKLTPTTVFHMQTIHVFFCFLTVQVQQLKLKSRPFRKEWEKNKFLSRECCCPDHRFRGSVHDLSGFVLIGNFRGSMHDLSGFGLTANFRGSVHDLSGFVLTSDFWGSMHDLSGSTLTGNVDHFTGKEQQTYRSYFVWPIPNTSVCVCVHVSVHVWV